MSRYNALLLTVIGLSLLAEPTKGWCGSSVAKGSMTDLRDGKAYPTARIGTQTWLAANLDFAASRSWCYEDSPENCRKYGRLYTWVAARKACPDGWHLPTDAEWTTLEQAVHADPRNLMSKDVGGTDSSGFNGLLAGFRYDDDDNRFSELGEKGNFWTATERGKDAGQNRELIPGYSSVAAGGMDRLYGFSVRCVR